MEIAITAMMPHAPVLLPEIGTGKREKCQSSFEACTRIASEIVASKPDCAIVFSPHTPVDATRKPAARTADILEIQFAEFGCRDFSASVVNLAQTRPEVFYAMKAAGPWTACGDEVLDHGAAVPLCFLWRAGWNGPVAVFGPDYFDGAHGRAMARAMAHALAQVPMRLAVIASADMSHALARGAPGGFHPDARHFDAHFLELLGSRKYREFETIDGELGQIAKQDALDTVLMALELTDFRDTGGEVFSYQAPFGVGYLCAILNRGSKG